MKAHLKFDLSDMDDVQEYKRCTKSTDMASVLWELLRNSRKEIEREFENNPEDKDFYEGVDAVYDRLCELLEENSINIDDLYS